MSQTKAQPFLPNLLSLAKIDVELRSKYCWLRESKGTDVLEIQLVYPITTEKEQLHTWGKEDRHVAVM